MFLVKIREQFLKRVFQEIKARQIFQKTNYIYTLKRRRTCGYQGWGGGRGKNARFLENLTCFVFLKQFVSIIRKPMLKLFLRSLVKHRETRFICITAKCLNRRASPEN